MKYTVQGKVLSKESQKKVEITDRQTDRQRNARPKPRTKWSSGGQTHIYGFTRPQTRRPHKHPSRRKSMPQTNPHTTDATLRTPSQITQATVARAEAQTVFVGFRLIVNFIIVTLKLKRRTVR